MKLRIENTNYKCGIEDSFSTELGMLTRETAYSKSTVIVITINEIHKEDSYLIKSIIKDVREVIRTLRGVDYLDDCITSVKFKNLDKHE